VRLGLPWRPIHGHTLGPVIADLGNAHRGGRPRGIHGDKGYRGHNYPDRFKVWISGQIRRVTKAIRREMRRRAAVEPVIGHLKDDHRMRRNYLKGRDGDRINAVLAAAGFNFSLLLSPSRAAAPCIVRRLKKHSSRTTSSLGIQLGHGCWGTIFLDGPRGNRFAAPDQLAIFQNTPVTLIHARAMKFRHLLRLGNPQSLGRWSNTCRH